jgi:hypothetical protein
MDRTAADADSGAGGVSGTTATACSVATVGGRNAVSAFMISISGIFLLPQRATEVGAGVDV